MFSLYKSVTSRQEIRDSGRTRSLFGDATTFSRARSCDCIGILYECVL